MKKAIYRLIRCFKKPNIDHYTKKDSAKKLIEVLLYDKNVYFRYDAAYALGKLGDTEVVDTLLIALQNQDNSIRDCASIALGEIGDPKAIKSLIKALKDEDEEVRKNAAKALGKIGDTKAVDPLIEALDNGLGYYAAKALRKLGNKKASLNSLERKAHKAAVKFQQKVTEEIQNRPDCIECYWYAHACLDGDHNKGVCNYGTGQKPPYTFSPGDHIKIAWANSKGCHLYKPSLTIHD